MKTKHSLTEIAEVLGVNKSIVSRILKLACTIADLAGTEETQSIHLAEALQYRPKLMMV